MTRVVVFLAATLVAASLGVMAQESSTAAGQSSSPVLQSSTENGAQRQAPSNPETASAGNVKADPSQGAAANDSSQATATGGTAKGVQDAAHGEDTANANNNGQLPQTSTILPLLGLIGLGSLVAGFFARR